MNRHLDNAPQLRWGAAHTVEVPAIYVRYTGTTAALTYLGHAPPFVVCADCRCSEELCRCLWRKSDVSAAHGATGDREGEGDA